MKTQSVDSRPAAITQNTTRLKRSTIINTVVLAIVTALFLQGCIHTQQPQSSDSIHITRVSSDSAIDLSDSQSQHTIGSFIVETQDSGAFLEGLSVVSAPSAIALKNIRIKMAGDDQWLDPRAINIYLDSKQQHHFDISATIEAGTYSTAHIALSDFRFLTSNANATVDSSSLDYSIALPSASQRSRS